MIEYDDGWSSHLWCVPIRPADIHLQPHLQGIEGHNIKFGTALFMMRHTLYIGDVVIVLSSMIMSCTS
jgi:hypothetical protein